MTPYEETSWYDHAACADLGTEAFFREWEYGGRTARAVCNACPVINECLQYALAYHIQDGVWGGMTPLMRKRHRAVLREQEGAA